MINFLFRGLIRDKQRSLFPIIIVAAGVMMTTWLFSWMLGVFNEIIEGGARFDTGHVKVTTRAYNEIASQMPNDLCLTEVHTLLNELDKDYPGYDWTPRIKFAGLADVPDENGETRAQAPVMGFAVDLLSDHSIEDERLQISKSIVRGSFPNSAGEIVISDELAQKLEVGIGETITLISVSANGGMAIHNFTLSGTVTFGMGALDRGAMIADISDIQYALDMENATGEILGFKKNLVFDQEQAVSIKEEFNKKMSNTEDEYSPYMITLLDQNGLGEYLVFAQAAGFLIVGIFVFAMSIVLWNTGLMSGIRRYGEVGIRLAMGETKSHIYKTMLVEAFLIGLMGSFIGTVIGVAGGYYFQEYGMDISGAFKNSTMMVNDVVRAQVTFTSYYIGFIPGVLAMLFGTAISGIGIFRRQTATLFKELEV
ncbi:MAG: ABC transporter permease [Bacteroidetes bacterium]|nr:ABC transporter permease [Bacteroidota bacterium]